MNEQDTRLQENLDRIGRMVPLPGEPPAGWEQRWVAATGHSKPGLFLRGARFMKKHIVWTSGLSAAAVLGIATLIFSAGGKRVEAATIFDRLRDAVARSRVASIVYHNVAGTLSDGAPFTMDLHAVVERGQDAAGPSLYADFGMRGGNINFALAGQSVNWNMQDCATEQVLVQTPAGGWAYFRMEELAGDFLKRNPSALPLYPLLLLARSGIYVDHLWDSSPENRMRMVNMDPAAMAEPQAFHDLIERIEREADEIAVEPLDDDRALLRASAFGDLAGQVFSMFSSSGSSDGLLLELFANAVFEVTYSATEGIQAIRVLNVGSAQGEIRVAFDQHAEGYSADLFDITTHTAAKPGPLFDFNAIERMFAPTKQKQE